MTQTENSLWKTLRLRRNVVALLALMGFFNVYSLRVNLSVAIVAMTKNYTIIAADGSTQYVQDFPWDSKQKGTILSSFFYGYIFTQMAGGWLGTKIGGAKVFGMGVLLTAVLNLVFAAMARLGIGVLIAIRIIEGFFEGVTYPCIHAVWARWAPPQERTRLAAFGFSGSYFGTLIGFPACGFLAEKLGWAYAFYIPGIVAIIWCIAWFICVKDDPQSDPWITQSELEFLQDALGDVKNQQISYPWKAFFTSMPVWAIIIAHFCENWGFYTMLTQLPTFVDDTMHFNIQAAGFLSAVPYLVMAISLQIAGVIIDKIRKKNCLTTTQVRKIFNCGAFLSQTIFMISAAFAETAFLSILFITMALGLGSFSWAAFSVNHLDIAPQHAGILMGISNTFATFGGIISPSVTGYIVQNKSKAEWRIVFCISGLIYLFGAIFYALFASGEVQPWAVKKTDKRYEDNEQNEEEVVYENYALTETALDR